MRRDHWQRRIAELDPETDFEEISRIVSYHEFPWDIQQSLSFALFRTYAVPSIGRLLFDTGEFTEHHLVTNGASNLLGEVFGDAGKHARAAFGVAQLPLGACVEIEMVVQIA